MVGDPELSKNPVAVGIGRVSDLVGSKLPDFEQVERTLSGLPAGVFIGLFSGSPAKGLLRLNIDHDKFTAEVRFEFALVLIAINFLAALRNFAGNETDLCHKLISSEAV